MKYILIFVFVFCIFNTCLYAQRHSGSTGDGFDNASLNMKVNTVERTFQSEFSPKDTTFDAQSAVFYPLPNGWSWKLTDINGRVIQQSLGDIILAGGSLSRGTYLMTFFNDKTLLTAQWYFW